MRVPPLTILLAFGLAALLFAIWPRVPADEPGDTPADAPPIPAPASDPTPGNDAVAERSPGVTTRTVIGKLVDANRAPVAEADVVLRTDAGIANPPLAATPLPQRARSGADGRFQVAGPALPGAVLVVEAAGFATAQLGDLPVGTDVVDVGTLVLQAGVLWHGIVTCEGRGVPDAKVSVLPLLDAGEPFAPLTQTVTTDGSGAFVCSLGPCPATLRVRAPGHRDAAPRRIDDPRQDLVVELHAVPRLRGRIVRAEDGRPLDEARVAVVAMRDHVPGDLRARGEYAVTTPATAGAFDLVMPEAEACYVEALAPGRVAQARGPFDGKQSHDGVVIELPLGVAVEGTLTFRGAPVSGHALLEPLAGGEPVAQTTIAAGGTFRLPPALPGRWRLRIGAERGALFEREITLELPGPLHLDVPLAEGVRLTGRVRGTVPEHGKVLCQHASGWSRGGAVQADGSFVVEHLAPGTWHLQCTGDASWETIAASLLERHLPPQQIDVVGTHDVQADVDAPSRRFGRITGTLRDPTQARVELQPRPGTVTNGEVLFNLLRANVDGEGTFTVPLVLPGEWDVVLTRGARTYTVRATVQAGQTTTVTFPE